MTTALMPNLPSTAEAANDLLYQHLTAKPSGRCASCGEQIPCHQQNMAYLALVVHGDVLPKRIRGKALQALLAGWAAVPPQ